MSGGADYWAARETAKSAALRIAANLSAQEKGLAVTAATRGLIDDVRHDQTQQRSFERTFLSLDCPDDNGDTWDYGDCGREMRRMLRAIDAPFRERIRDLRFAAALDALDGHPELQRTLRAIRRHRRRETIVAALGLPPDTYAKRFTRICRILFASSTTELCPRIATSENMI